MPDSLTILLSLLSSSALSGALLFLFRNWISERLKASIQHEYDQKLESHKAKLEAESAIAIEHLKAQLQISATERSIKLSKVFEDQANVITDVYGKLVILIGAIEEYTSIITYQHTPSLEARRKNVGDKMGDFTSYYRPRRIFLPKAIQVSIDAFTKELHARTLRFMFEVEQEPLRKPKTEDDDTWLNTVNFMSKDVVKIMGDLDAELKKILGLAEVETTTQTNPSAGAGRVA
jgi:hypothetical protein